MNNIELYEFDRQEFVLLPHFSTKTETICLSNVVDRLEANARLNLDQPKTKVSKWGPQYYHSSDHGYHFQREIDHGKTLIIEVF